jgi:hypothetical protein
MPCLARSLRAACRQCAPACRQRARSVLILSAEFFETLSCHVSHAACAQHACRGLDMSCLGLGMSCLGLGIAPFKAFRESEATGSLECRGLPCLGIAPNSRHSEKVRLLEAWHAYPCTQPARIVPAACAQHAASVGRIFRTLSNPIFIEISPHNKLPIIKSMIFRTFSNLQNDF